MRWGLGIRPAKSSRKLLLHAEAAFAIPLSCGMTTAASVKRHGLDPWAYLTHVLSELPKRTVGSDLGDLLPDERAKARGEMRRRVG